MADYVIDLTTTGLVLADVTVILKALSDLTNIDQTGVTLAEVDAVNMPGRYRLRIPAGRITGRSMLYVFETADPLHYREGIIGPSDGDEAQQSTLAVVKGLLQANQVIDEMVYGTGNRLQTATIYVYDTAAHAATHDKATGLIEKLAVTVTRAASGIPTLMKTLEA